MYSMDISGIPYMLRVDLPDEFSEDQNHYPPGYCKDYFFEIMGNFQDYSDLSDYLIGYEVSQAGKHHMQCILWFPEPLTQVVMSKYRNWWKHYYASKTKRQPVAFTKSIAPDRLLSYCNKDGVIVSSLSQELISQIPMWREKIIKEKDKEEEKKKNRVLFNEFCRVSYEELKKEDLSEFYFREQFLTKISSSYFVVYNNPMRRNIGLSKLFEYKLMSHNQYIRSLYNGIFFFQ